MKLALNLKLPNSLGPMKHYCNAAMPLLPLLDLAVVCGWADDLIRVVVWCEALINGQYSLMWEKSSIDPLHCIPVYGLSSCHVNFHEGCPSRA